MEVSNETYTGWPICEHQPGPCYELFHVFLFVSNSEVLPWCETLRAKLHGGSFAFAGAIP